MIPLVLLLALASTTETRTFKAVTDEASTSGSPIVLDLFTVWCKPCAALEKEVFANPSVVAALAKHKAKLIRYDAERGEGLPVAEAYNVHEYPTVLVLAPDGTLLARVTGQSPDEFIAEAAPLLAIAAVKGPFTDEVVSKKDADPRAIFIAGLQALNGRVPNPGKAAGLFDAAAARDTSNALGVKAQAMPMAAQARYMGALKALQVKTLTEMAQGDPASEKTLSAYGALSAYQGAFDPAAMQSNGVRLRKALTESKNVGALSSLVYAQFGLLDFNGALETAKAIEAMSPSPDVLDTVAEAYFQANQKEKAVEVESAAYKAMPIPPLKANLERFKTEEPSPPQFHGVSPLAALEKPAAGPMAMVESEVSRLGSTLADACAPLKGSSSGTYVRLAFKGPKVARSVAFDSEAPAALRACLEKNAKTLSTVIFVDGKLDVRVTFALVK